MRSGERRIDVHHAQWEPDCRIDVYMGARLPWKSPRAPVPDLFQGVHHASIEAVDKHLHFHHIVLEHHDSLPELLQQGQTQGLIHSLKTSISQIHEKPLELKPLQGHSEEIELLFLTTPVSPHWLITGPHLWVSKSHHHFFRRSFDSQVSYMLLTKLSGAGGAPTTGNSGTGGKMGSSIEGGGPSGTL